MTTFDEPPITDGPIFEPVATFGTNGDAAHASGIVCSECSTTFVHDKPGRRPKKCPDCRTVRTTTATRGTRITNLEAALTDATVGIGAAVCMFDAFDGQVIMGGAPTFAHALSDVASRDPKVRKALERALSSMGWGQVILAAAMIAAPIMAHHGILPSSVSENMMRMMSMSPSAQASVNVPAS